MSTPITKDQLVTEFEGNRERYLKEWFEFLSFQSISTDNAYDPQCSACADWLVAHLKKIGFEAKLLPTSTKPVVYGEFKGPAGAPTVVYYGHYDVQPVDPLNLWQTEPFKPELREGRVFARGAQDNKGQTFYVLKALETLVKHKALGYTVKILIEGEEESGSEGISEGLTKWKEDLTGDILMICDTGTLAPGLAMITMGLRGIVYANARLFGLRTDLHSGVHGGLIKNPAAEMAKLVASLYSADGRIAVSGFYDQVREADPADRQLANAVPFDPAEYKQQVGVEPIGGEVGFSPFERRGFRPTLEVNGLHSGYGGQGTKTIIPAESSVKLSARLVGGQDPKRSLDLIIAHLKKHAPKGLDFEITDQGVGGEALLLKTSTPHVQRAKKVLDEVSGRDTAFLWEGASIPIIPALVQKTGAEPLMVGFGLEEDNIHAPNESFALDQFRQGYLYAAMFLAA